MSLNPLPAETAAAFRAQVTSQFRYTDLVLRLAETDMLTRILIETFIAAPAPRDSLYLALGIRCAELACPDCGQKGPKP